MNSEKIVCPVDRTLNLISKKWSIQIIRDMFFRKKHFKLTEYGRSMNRIIYELAMFTLNDDLDDNYPKNLRNELKNNFKETLEIDD